MLNFLASSLDDTTKGWKPRKHDFSIGRLAYIPLGSDEFYYLRILLTNQKSCINYDSIKSVNGVICKTYKRGLPCNGTSG